MTSKRFSDSVRCMMKEDIKHRLDLLAVSCLCFFFMYPVATLLLISRAGDNVRYMEGYAQNVQLFTTRQILAYYNELYSGSYDTALIILLASVVAIRGFMYLMHGNWSDAFHSLPFRRSVLYTAIVLDGIALVMIPCGFFALLSGIIATGATGSSWPLTLILTGYLHNIPRFLLCYGVTIFAVMLTGYKLIAWLATIFFYMYMPWIGTIVYGLAEHYFKTFFSESTAELIVRFSRLSPLFFCLDKEIKLLGSALLTSFATLALAVVLIYLTYMLYRIRPLENAGKPLVFDRIRFPIKLLITVPGALSGVLMASQLDLGEGWAIFAFFCAIILVHAILEIIFSTDFKKAFAHKREFLICLACAGIIFLIYGKDLLGYDRYLPREDQLASIGITGGDMESNTWLLLGGYELEKNPFDDRYNLVEKYYSTEDQLNEMHYTDMENIYELMPRAIAYTLEETSDDDYMDDDLSDVHTSNMIVYYHLKSGRTVRRYYIIDLDECNPFLDKIHDSQEFKINNYPVLSMTAADLDSIRYEDPVTRHNLMADDALNAKLLETYKSELSSLTMAQRRTAEPIACIRFKDRETLNMYQVMKAQEKNYYDFTDDYGYYPVYPFFRGTIACLKEAGADVENFYNESNFSCVYLDLDAQALMDGDMDYEETDDQGEMTDGEDPADEYDDGKAPAGEMKRRAAREKYMEVSDPAQIREVLDACVPMLTYSNNLSDMFYSMSVNGELSEEMLKEITKNSDYGRVSRTVNFNLLKDRIPGFVKDYFELTQEEIDTY